MSCRGSIWDFVCFQNLSDVTTDSTNKLIRNGSTASTDSGVIGQDESHGSQQSSPNNSLTPSQRMSWPDFKHTAETSHMSASCSDLTKPQVGMFMSHDCHMTPNKVVLTIVLHLLRECHGQTSSTQQRLVIWVPAAVI